MENQLYKNDIARDLLFKLFSGCFENGIQPNIFGSRTINPIPKSGKNDLRIPLNNRGVMLILCVGKMYSGLLNNRLRYFLEVNEILSEEQNGFCKGRSYTEHIFSFITVCKIRLKECKQTFCCFVDLQKAFDCVDRTKFFTRLLGIGITGKLFSAIKSHYDYTTGLCKRTIWQQCKC